MPIGDHAGEIAIDKLTNETLPALTKAVNDLIIRVDAVLDEDIKRLIDDVHGILDRLNKATVTFNLPERTK